MSDKIQEFIEYLNYQFPATVGHIPIREKLEEIRLEKPSTGSSTKNPKYWARELHEWIKSHPNDPLTSYKIEDTIKFAIENLTPEQVHNLCHDLEKTVSPAQFTEGCKTYQKKLFGQSPIADLEQANKAANALIGEMAEEAKRQAKRADLAEERIKQITEAVSDFLQA